MEQAGREEEMLRRATVSALLGVRYCLISRQQTAPAVLQQSPTGHSMRAWRLDLPPSTPEPGQVHASREKRLAHAQSHQKKSQQGATRKKAGERESAITLHAGRATRTQPGLRVHS